MRYFVCDFGHLTYQQRYVIFKIDGFPWLFIQLTAELANK